MTLWKHYLEDVVAWKEESKELLSVMKEVLEQVDYLDEKGNKFLFNTFTSLASESRFEFSEIFYEMVMEDIPPETTATYLMEVACASLDKSLSKEMVDPLVTLFEPIFNVDFPQIYGALFSRLLTKVEEKDPTAIERTTNKIRQGITVLTN